MPQLNACTTTAHMGKGMGSLTVTMAEATSMEGRK